MFVGNIQEVKCKSRSNLLQNCNNVRSESSLLLLLLSSLLPESDGVADPGVVISVAGDGLVRTLGHATHGGSYVGNILP